jgi:tetratricopeptide (TPR) repeat protein
MKRLLLCLVAVAALGCGPGKSEYLRAKYAGDRAKTSGRYDEAARAYHQAAEAAKTPRDRDEALYLEGATLVQAGRVREGIAALEGLAKANPHGDRADRASFDRAFLEIEHGDEQAGWKMLEATIFERPSAGSARRALAVLVRHMEDKQKGAGLVWIEAHLGDLEKSALGEDGCYMHAHHLADAERLREARNEFVRCADRYPYPGGSLRDDSLWNASVLDEKLGDPKAAIADLQALLSTRESSSLGQGSYERPRYSPAQYRIAELYRDKVGDLALARQAFHRVYTAHPTSTLRDDALWQEAVLAKKQNDPRAVCDLMVRLTKDMPESRYSGCADALCPDVKPSEKAPKCRKYVLKAIGMAPPGGAED